MEPTSNGIGGDLFASVYLAKEDKLYGINATAGRGGNDGRAPESKESRVSCRYRGLYTVTVPGACRLGALPPALRRLRWPRTWPGHLVRPRTALNLVARNGSVLEVMDELWSHSVQMLGEDPESRATFLTGGRNPQGLARRPQPQLARSLPAIAEQGIDGFYRGPTRRPSSTWCANAAA